MEKQQEAKTNNAFADGIAFELLKEVKHQSRRWMYAFFTVLFFWLATIGGFVWFLNQYDIVSYTQDGEGYSNINTGDQGDVINGATTTNTAKKER